MKHLAKRSMSFLLALVLCLSLLSGICFHASAATVEYRYGSTSEYSQCSNVIYNWGKRGELATFLSPNAEKFYKDNNTSYSALSQLTGSSTESAVPNSKLFTTLRTLMTNNHSYVNNYNQSRDMFAFTDCEGSALSSTKISSFYSGAQIGPGWDSGSTWNREHTWPNSKGDANGNGENDIMMLRPASSSENSGRNNTAYGESSSYYNPNKASGGTYDLRGDVARIVLYVYVRWQDTSSEAAVLFGTNGVIESKEVMLKWMEEDPVDTWEMGRNDSVQSITGTRNVFVDYPELGFLLYGTSVPADYQSPSNNSGTGGDTETVTVAFMENGKQTKTYSVTPGQSVEMPAATVTPDSGYSFAGWVTNTLEETTAKPANVYLPGSTLAATDQTYYALYTRIDTTGGGTSSDVFKLHTGSITEGDYLIVSDSGAMSTAVNGTSTRRDVVNVNISDDTISSPSADLIWHIAPSGTSYTIYNSAESKYLAGTGAKTAGTSLNKNITDYTQWTITAGDPVVIENDGNKAKEVNYLLRRNSTYGFACYAASTGSDLTLYKATTGTTYYSTVFGDACAHATTTTNTVDATCTENGSITVTCSSCGEVLSTTVITATGHSYETVVTPPTAESEGYTTYICSICGYSYNSDFVPALGYDYTVSFSVPAGIGAVEDMIGNKSGITLPSVGAPAGYTFAGWTNQPLEETTEEPSVFTGTYIPTENTTLYALYTRKEISGSGSGDYEKVSAAPADWAGEYVIVYEDGSCVFDSSLTKLDAANNYKSVTISDGTIAASEAEPYKFTIEAVSGGYSIQSASGYYIGATGNSNSLNASTSTAYANTLSVNDDGTVNVLGSGGAYLRYNSASNQQRFRYYKSSTYTGQKAICLYKKSAGSTVIYYATLTPASVASVSGVEYTSFEKAYAQGNADSNGWCCVKLLADVSVSNLTLDHDLYIDLNGFDLELNIGEIKNDALIYGLDSTTDSFDATSWGKLSLSGVDVRVNPYAADLEGHRYVTAAEADGSWSFHGYLVQMVAVSLKPGADALGYKARFFGDSVASSMVTSYGFHIAVENGRAKTVTKEEALENGQSFSLRLQGIMEANGGELYIDADAFVNFSNGATGMTYPQSTTMRQTLETIEANLEYDANAYSAQQVAALQAYITAFESKMTGWDIDTIKFWTAA